MKLSRNDPCPCGSGKKYKHCHLLLEQSAPPDDFGWHRLRRAIDDLASDLLRTARRHFGEGALDEAWAEFNLWETEEPFDPDTAYVQVFMPWFFYDWLPDPLNTQVPPAAHFVTAGEAYLRRAGAQVDPLRKRYVQACVNAPFSFHEAITCDPGRGFRLRDVLLGTESDVIERSGSEGARTGDLLYAKVVATEGVAILEGCTPVLIPRKYKPEIIEFRASISRQGDAFAADPRREYGMELRDLYLAIADELLHPELPKLANTDGDPLEFHTLIYDLDAPRNAFGALKDLATGMTDEDIMRDAEFAGDGTLVRAEISWRKRGNARHAGRDNTLLGTVRIEGTRLTAEVNSAARAERLSALLEQRLGSSARKRPTAIQSVQSLLDHEPTAAERAASREREAESARLAQLPEVKAAIGDMLRRHYQDWVDQKIPALGERTPREAVRDADGREAVEALIVQIERDGGQMQPALDPTIPHELRATLGLPQPDSTGC